MNPEPFSAVSGTAITIQLVVGLLFLLSTVAKIREPMQLFHTIGDFFDGRFGPLSYIVGSGLILSEVVVAISHLTGLYLSVVVPFTITLLTCFLTFVIVSIYRDLSIDCMCFGVGETVSWRTASRVVVLLAGEGTLYYISQFHLLIELPLLVLMSVFICSIAVITLFNWLLRLTDLVEFLRTSS